MSDNTNKEESENNSSENQSEEVTSSHKEILNHQTEETLKTNKNINQIESVNNFEFLHQKELNKKESEKPEIIKTESNNANDEINKLKNQLIQEKKLHEQEIYQITSKINEKETTLKSISNVNSGLEKTYNVLKTKIENLKSKRNYSVKEKEEPIKITIDIKEKEIQNIQFRVNSLSKENQSMQSLLDKFSDLENKRERTDRLMFMENENNKLKNEINILKNLTKEHEFCNKEKEDLRIILKELENQINNTKKDIINDKLEYKILEEHYYNYKSNRSEDNIMKLRKKLKFEMKSENNDIENINEINNNNDNINSLNTNNNKIMSFHKYNITQSFDYSAQKKQLRELAKKKTIQYILKENYELLSDNEKEEIFNLFGEENKEQYHNFMKKIKKLENYKKLNYEPSKTIKKQEEQNKRMNEINNQIDYLVSINNEKEIQVKFLEAKIKEYKSHKKALQKQINNLIKNLNELKNRKKLKEKENKNLINKIIKIKEEVKNNCYEIENEK